MSDVLTNELCNSEQGGSESANGEILIACMGNIFLGDDGFGVEVARALAGTHLPDGSKVVDYGIRGLDLAYALIKPWRAVILADAVSRGGVPGDLYILRPAEEIQGEPGLDPHSMDPQRVLGTARSLGTVSAPVYILGCEPQDCGEELEGRMGLSPVVQAVIPSAVSMVQRLIQKLMAEEVPAGIAT
jgi:hydrogenase maturation protease